MKSQFFQKICIWLIHKLQNKAPGKGAMTLITAFLFFAFSTLGLGMLYLSQIYLKLGSYKKNAVILAYASENGIKDAYNQLTQFVRQIPLPIVLAPEKAADLSTDAKAKGTLAVEELLGSTPPLRSDDFRKNMHWSTQTNFMVKHFEEYEDHCHEILDVIIQADGFITNFNEKRTTQLLALLELWIGHIPLSTFPFLIDKNLSPGQQEAFIADHNIEVSSSSKDVPLTGICFSPEEVIPSDATPLVKKALKINIFQPQELSSTLLREALGLEPSNDPVPDGVYLIQDDFGLGGIYVEGNLDEMVLAIDHESQVISFRSEIGQWQLKFNPMDIETIFISPEGAQSFNLTPRGIIVVNGEIRSLGGGTVNASGEVLMVKDEEIPCILKGVSLTIVSSEKTTLSSHLIHQGMKWEDGVPYIKDNNSQLHIFAAGQDVQGMSNDNGGIVIASDSPDDLKVQATITASGKGISVEGKNKTVNIFGSLQASYYIANGNGLQLTHDQRITSDKSHRENGPKSSKPILHVATYGAMEWQENQ